MTIEERFWAKVNKDGPIPDYAPHLGSCWIWTAGHDGNGYGHFQMHHKECVKAHRVAYELSVGPIPEGLVIDHLCRVHGCVNPDHLEPVTNGENIRRGLNVVQNTHCKHGHLYVEGSFYLVMSEGKLKRRCNACGARRQREYRARKRARQ